MDENIFLVLGIQSREDCISNALAYAFNASPGFRQNFLKEICEKNLDRYALAQAYTRVSAGAPGIPDIVIALSGASSADIVVIENKLKAEEGDDQTERYASQEAVSALANRLVPEKLPGEPSFVFLTLFPDQEPAAGNRYLVRRHSDLKNVAANISEWGSTLAKTLMTDWLSLIDRFYAREKVSLDDKFLERLTDDSGLDGGYLYFRSALKQLNLPSSLDLEDFYRASQQGRRYYGVTISKESWHPGEMTESSGFWLLNPATDYNIHFEPQYNVVSKLFSLYLHYEINPYETESWAQANVSQDQYDAYVSRRTNFLKNLEAKGLPGWSFGGGSNQVAKATFDFRESSYAEAKATLEQVLSEGTNGIDSVLQEML